MVMTIVHMVLILHIIHATGRAFSGLCTAAAFTMHRANVSRSVFRTIAMLLGRLTINGLTTLHFGIVGMTIMIMAFVVMAFVVHGRFSGFAFLAVTTSFGISATGGEGQQGGHDKGKSEN